MKNTLLLVGGLVVIFLLFINLKSKPASDATDQTGAVGQTELGNGPMAVVTTNFGVFELELFADQAPETVANFVKLAQAGFYNGTLFHRVIKGFMVQGGDPLSREADWSKHGTGGPDYTFADEINQIKLTRGVLAMANAGPNTNGSQFFIVTGEATPWLDGFHTAFGRVTKGMEVVDAIENTPTDSARGDHPLNPVTVESITIK